MSNRVEKYEGFSDEEVKADLYSKSLPYAVLMMQIQGDFNFGTVVRNANAFGAREAFYYGPRKKWDRRSAVGTYHYTKVTWLPEANGLDEILKLKESYPNFIGVDILPGISSNMEEFDWQAGSLMVFGEEGLGLSSKILEMCDHIVHITQRGSVPSVNVGTASGIAMFDFGRRYEKKLDA